VDEGEAIPGVPAIAGAPASAGPVPGWQNLLHIVARGALGQAESIGQVSESKWCVVAQLRPDK